MQIVGALEFNASVFLAAVLSGAVFGDHASPISDTTVVASMAAATDHIDHVRTQLPYALLSAGLAAVAFFVSGLVLL
jgi:Na+/H+ antiporter NhaC